MLTTTTERFIEQAVRQAAPTLRLDAGETAATIRALLYIQSQTYDVMYPDLKFRKFIPITNEVSTGADSYAYRQWDKFGKAKIVTNYADDLPLANAQIKEFINPVKSVGAAYQYSIQDLRRVGFDGLRLDLNLALAARRMIEEILDNVAGFGDVSSNLGGFLNNSNVSIDAATGNWSGLTSTQVVADMNKLVTNIFSTTLETIAPDTLLLPTTTYVYVSQTPFTSAGGVVTDKTILAWFLSNNPWIKNVDSWYQLETAGAGSVKRAVCYKRDPMVLQGHIPQEFEQLAPEVRNLSFMVNCHARSGGVAMHYPKGVRYMDGI